MLGKPALSPVAGLGIEAIDEVDHVVEAATGAGSDAAPRDSDGQMGLAGTRSADQHDVALLGDEAAASEIIDKRLVDRRALAWRVSNRFGHPVNQLVERHRIVSDPHAGRVIDCVSDRRSDAAEAEFADALGLHRR